MHQRNNELKFPASQDSVTTKFFCQINEEL